MTDENPVILQDYTLIKDIGEGNFGKVKLARLKSTKEKFAIKILDKEKLKTQTKSTLFNEIEIISRLNHKNIIHVEKILEDTKNFYIIMEYCEKGELFDYIVHKERLNSAEASLFFYQLINGVEYIHKQGFAHRDLKPENLLLTKEKVLKIIDFGLCHDFDGENFLTTKCGSPSYAAPEILKGFPYDGFKTDIWCCGIILYAMLCGYLPFDGDNNQEIFQSIVECKPEFPDFLEDDSINLLMWILNGEPKDRISIEDIKYHPFYLKGKSYYTIQYEESDTSDLDRTNDHIRKDINYIKNGFSVDKRKFGYSTNRRKKGNMYTFNNINNGKRFKLRENKHLKNNIYQKIFNKLININEDESSSKIKTQNNAKYLLTTGNEGRPNINEYNIKNGNIINGIKDKIKLNNKKLETEGNDDRKSLYMEFYRNKFMANYSQKKSHNKKNNFPKNEEDYSYKFNYFNINNNTINPKIYNYDSYNINIDKKNNLNSINIEIHKHNIYNIINKRKDQKITLRHNNKFLDNKTKKLFLKSKKDPISDFKTGRVGNQEQLDFFQKFLINKNKPESLEKSPKKIIGINCNLILTKNREKNDKEDDTIKLEEHMNKKDSQSYDNTNNNTNNNSNTSNKNNLTINEHILLSNKKNKYDIINKDSIFNKELNLLKSPVQSINVNNNYRTNSKPNKFFNLIYNSSNKNKARSDNQNDRINIGCRSCSIKRSHPRRKNLKIDINNRLNNLRIINLNSENNTIQKDSNHKEQQDINLLTINKVFKTEQKNIHFLDKVIQKLNSGKDKKNKMHIFINPKNNEENKQVFRFLSLEKNNNEFLVNPFFVKYHINNQTDDEKKQPIQLKDENHFLEKINHKIDLNLNNGNKIKKLFPNLIPFNKK